MCCARRNCHFFTLARVHANRLFDPITVPIRHSRDDGGILLFDGSPRPLLCQRHVRRIGLGHNDHARRIAIEPVDNSRPAGTSHAAESGKMVRKSICQRATPMSATGMHHHPRRLIDHHQGVIFVQDVQGNRFGSRHRARQVGHRNDNALPGVEPISGLGAAIVNQYASDTDGPPQLNPTVCRTFPRQKNIETYANILLPHNQLDRFSSTHPSYFCSALSLFSLGSLAAGGVPSVPAGGSTAGASVWGASIGGAVD